MSRQRRTGAAVSNLAFADGAASPRKRPAQARSQDTVEAILTAALQVLTADGDLTTTRVAELAGVSIGTLYQYFGSREALITGVLAAHLEGAIGAVEAAAIAATGWARRDAIAHVVRAFLAAKAASVDVAVALDRVVGVGKIDERPVVIAATRRAQLAVARVLGDPTDAAVLQRAGVACAALEGIVRAVLVEDPRRLADPAWHAQVVALALAATS